jgi:hypothetical protein
MEKNDKKNVDNIGGRPPQNHYGLICPKCKKNKLTINNRNPPNKLIPHIIQYKCNFTTCKKTFYAVEDKYVLDDLTFDNVADYCEYRRRFAFRKIIRLISDIENNIWDLNEHPKSKTEPHHEFLDVVAFTYEHRENTKIMNQKYHIDLDGD